MWGYLMLRQLIIDNGREMLAKSDTSSTNNYKILTHRCRKENLSIHPKSKQIPNMLCCSYLELFVAINKVEASCKGTVLLGAIT